MQPTMVMQVSLSMAVNSTNSTQKTTQLKVLEQTSALKDMRLDIIQVTTHTS